MHVHIQNFQSLKDVQFDISGFTVLVGRSNLGKSAAIRAIEGALFNAPVEAYVRDGASSLMVRLTSPDFDIQWRKGGGHNDYTVDGVSFESVGRDVPDVIRQKGFRDLEVNKNHLRVQVSDQFHPLFLLDCTGTDAAQAISDVHRIYEIQSAQEAVDKDRRAVRAEIKVREKDLLTAKDRALRIDLLGDKVQHLRALVTRGGALTREQERVQRLRAGVGALTRAHEGVRARARVQEIAMPTLPTPSYKESARDARLYQNLTRRLAAHKDLPLPNLPRQVSPQIQRDLSQSRILQRHLKNSQQVGSLQIPQMPDRRPLESLRQAAKKMTSSIQAMQSLREEILACNAQMASLEEQIRAMIAASTTCPMCGQDTSHQHP